MRSSKRVCFRPRDLQLYCSSLKWNGDGGFLLVTALSTSNLVSRPPNGLLGSVASGAKSHKSGTSETTTNSATVGDVEQPIFRVALP